MKNINQKEYKALLELGLIESIPKSQFDKNSDNHLEVKIEKSGGQQILYYKFVENFDRELNAKTKLNIYRYQKITAISMAILASLSLISLVLGIVAVLFGLL